jgi:uncharacterized Ntn-hydrolase superfamily protein
MKHLITLCLCIVTGFLRLLGQDTFSIVAVDSVTGEVGSAGASCVDLFGTIYTDHFLGDLIPGVGAINTQAYYLGGNQGNARTRMNAGDTPQQIIDWLVANDVQGNPAIRQYGIVGFVNGAPQSAAHTGVNTNDYKGHVLGPHYSIQGNILLGPEVLDSMEARFLAAQGDLACKLMAALQGANMVGADTRCAGNGSSSLFAFVKVSQPTDPYNAPSFVVSVRTHANAGIEPIDTLQTLFDAVKNCAATSAALQNSLQAMRIYPNPAQDRLQVLFPAAAADAAQFEILDAVGRTLRRSDGPTGTVLEIGDLPAGMYMLRVQAGEAVAVRPFVKL